MSENQINIVPFDFQLGMDIQSWLKHFKRACSIEKKDEEWKKQNISKYLKGEALKVFINDCLNFATFDEIVEILTEKFIQIRVPKFSEFASLKLNELSELDSYFRKKVEVGRQLQLGENIIIQGLTDGLKPEYQNCLIVNPPSN